ncbi:MAG TPA: ABC transporter permease [Nocardioides sp.]|nr:ABC transporter permease [Nocardioides sp.]
MTTTPLAAAPVTTPAPPAARAGRRRERQSRSRLSFLRRSISPIAIVLVWQALSSTGVLDPRTLESPLHIAQSAVDLTSDGTLVHATLASLRRVALGFLVGGTIGMGLAILAGLWRIGEDAVDPPLQMLRTLPHFGLIPLFILWFGIGEEPKILLIALGVMFPLYLNTFAGIRGIDRRVLEAARSMHLSWAQRLRHVVIPGALPQTLTGLRQSLGIAWLSLIVAETISASDGLGHMINDAREFLQTDVIVVGLAVYSLLGLATDGVVRFLEGRALAWRS